MKRKRTMGSSTHPPRPSLSGVAAISATPACQQRSDDERDHQMEKLQVALAVAVSRGDASRIQDLRNRIAEFGDSGAEPGTCTCCSDDFRFVMVLNWRAVWQD